MSDVRLTDEERAAIIAALPADPDAPFLLLDEVERILASRLTPIEALVDTWSHVPVGGWRAAADELRRYHLAWPGEET